MSAILYVRVSDQRQVDNTSLVSQEAVCRSWCEQNGLGVDRVFIERGESAKSANRTEFQTMFRYLEQARKGRITHVVVFKFDRFSRNVEDGAVYRVQLRNLGIVLRSATEQTDDSPAGRFLTTLLNAVGQFDNDNRTERSVAGMKSRLGAGRWVWVAPVGYLNGGRAEPSLIHDPARAPHVARMFDLVAGGHSKASALQRVTELGLRTRRGGALTQQTMLKVLTNPLYTGQILVKGWNISMKGDFMPIVTEDRFDEVQRVLDGRASAQVAHVRDSDKFPLRGLLLCPTCMKPLTASTSTGKLGTKYGYYRCYREPGHVNVRADVVEAQFLDLLDRLTPKPERMRLIEKVFRDRWDGLMENSASESLGLRQQVGKLEARQKRILLQMADGDITVEDFAQLKAATSSELAGIRDRLAIVEGAEPDKEESLAYILHLIWNPSLTWETAPLQDKQRLQRRMFPEGLILDKTGVGTPVSHSIYTLLADDSVDEECLASPTGFEPVLPP